MVKRIDFQEAFIAGVKAKLLPFGWGGQKRVATMAGISSSYLCDILSKRKKATEETRRSIAQALQVTYDELLTIGRNIGNGNAASVIKECLQYDKFSKEKACCIYQYAAMEVGILDSYFLTGESLNRSRPPGWLDYLSKEIDDGTLYDYARKEMAILQEQIMTQMEQKTSGQETSP